jgi:hypothetical protein
MKEGAGSCRNLQNEELYTLHSSRNIIRIITPRRKKPGICKKCINISVGNPEGRNQLEDLRVDGALY